MRVRAAEGVGGDRRSAAARSGRDQAEVNELARPVVVANDVLRVCAVGGTLMG